MDRRHAYAITPETDLKQLVSTLPTSPGVYVYRNSSLDVLYVGKASNLKNRVSQYLLSRDAVGDKTAILVSQLSQITVIETASEFDAILLEAKLIYGYQPKYNVIAKDDKSPVYISISFSELLPSVTLVRKPRNPSYGVSEDGSGDMVFGPFQSTRNARGILRSIRRIVPYCTQKKRTGSKCFYTHIGLCDPCPSYITGINDPDNKKVLSVRYRRNLFRIRDILSGKSSAVRRDLERQMMDLAKSEQYEKAQDAKNRLTALTELLTRRYNPMLYMMTGNAAESLFTSETEALKNTLLPYYPELAKLSRIECIDISNTGGGLATGSLVVVTDGFASPGEYRKFRIRSKQTPDDYEMMREVIIRRLKHGEWVKPDLLVVDGGKGQVHAATHAINDAGESIPVIGLAKRNEEIIIPGNSKFHSVRLSFADPAIRLLMRIRDEAHRFTLTYHRKLRSQHALQVDTIKRIRRSRSV